MKRMRVLVFDPSGNMGKREGDGTTGWAVFDDGQLTDFGAIKSEDYDTQEDYWHAHIMVIFKDGVPVCDEVVCESYKLFAFKAAQQSWSTMDTPQLIGYLRMICWSFHIPVYFQDPADKIRVTDPILVKLGVFELKGKKHYCMGRPTVIHMRDAIRHGIFYHKFGRGKAYVKRSSD